MRKPESRMSPEDMKRKGSWAVRFFGREPLPPLVDDKGRPTRLALSAHAWGEEVPKTEAEARKIADTGHRLLERYRATKTAAGKTAGPAVEKMAVKKTVARKTAAEKTAAGETAVGKTKAAKKTAVTKTAGKTAGTAAKTSTKPGAARKRPPPSRSS